MEVSSARLNPDQIDKVEIISKPSSNYDGNTTGAINIILKKEQNSGISGQVYAEIPTSGSQIFLRPTYSLNYGYNKLNLYTSYKGEFTYLDIHEETIQKQFSNNGNIGDQLKSVCKSKELVTQIQLWIRLYCK